MDVLITLIRAKRWSPIEPEAQLFDKYLRRAGKYVPSTSRTFATEDDFFEHLARSDRRTAAFLTLLDSRGKQMSSEDFAQTLTSVQDSGTQQFVLAIGPSSGWSPDALRRANLTLAFGRMTLPHELAAMVAAEQLYRALTIAARHPYHLGH